MAQNVDKRIKEYIKEYEDEVNVIGYYCSTCKKDWVLENWNGNTVPNDTMRALQNYHQPEKCFSHFTREDAGGFVKYVCQKCRTDWRLKKVTEVPAEGCEDDEQRRILRRENKIFGYMCCACKKEWLVDGVQGVDEDMQNLRRHRHNRTSFFDVEQDDGTLERTRWECATCKKEWLLPCWNERDQTLHILNGHHQKQGCEGEVGRKGDSGYEEYGLEEGAKNIIGYYCKNCKTEWLSDEWNRNPAPSIGDQVVEHHYVPTFKHLRISDTGIRVYWHDVEEKLQRGDHIAWQRLLKYWHHAIVEKVEGHKVTVIEWTSHICKKICCCPNSSGIRRRPINMSGCRRELMDSPMYKVVYPEAVQMQNPPDLVLLRARERLHETGYKITSDNCEHFATFCKTGWHTSRQVGQAQLTCQAYGVKRLVIALAYVLFLISFAEMVEQIFGKGKDYVGLAIIGIVEVIYVLCKICCLYHRETPRENFTKERYSHCTRACVFAVCKIIFKSFCMLSGTFLITFFLLDSVHIKKIKKEWKVMAEIVVTLAGGLCGSAVGFLLVDRFTLCSFCCVKCYPGIVTACNLCGRAVRFLSTRYLTSCSCCCCSMCCRGQADHERSQRVLDDVEQNYQSINT